jgi:dolichol-phosphate mannosyltransferase
MKISSLSVIIPSYNEAETIARVVEKVLLLSLKIKKEIIVVDDGSRDESKEIIKKAKYSLPGVIWLSHKINQGKGAAIKTGLERATGEYVIIQDADLECDPTDIPLLVKQAEKSNSLAVFGSRNRSSRKYLYFYYYYGGMVLTYITNFLFRQNLTDVTNGYKMIRRDIFKKLNIEEKGFGVCLEIAAKLSSMDIHIDEVPVSYFPRTFQEGKKLRKSDGLRGLFILISIFIKNIWLRIPIRGRTQKGYSRLK